MLDYGCTCWDGFYWAGHDRVEFFVGDLDGRKWVVEYPERKCQINSNILVSFRTFLEQVLNNFNTNSTDYHGSSGRNSRNNLPSNKLNLEIVNLVNLIISSSQIRNTTHKLNVPVSGIIFLELNDCGSVDGVNWNFEKLVVKVLDLGFILFVDFDGLLFFASFVFLIGFDFNLFWSEFLWFYIFGQAFNNILIALQLDIKNKSNNVSGSLYELNLHRIVKIKRDNFRSSFQT